MSSKQENKSANEPPAEALVEAEPEKPFVEPSDAAAYARYLDDWKYRMKTFERLQSEYMRPGRFY